ncbi:hypothetical protein [Roseofilum sp. Guam]|uniref:hypothetical protein n=1 Tax=Roseofilum sp. Guam TaxID=2821502 RepID=UPI001B2BB90E|nr:hypothetical protein [Roseofilum sp. Guam]MBP0031250.1 hypothetical protein [Roseofilum sp. Guam]
MLRFLQQLEVGSGDYTLERHQASVPTLEEFQQFTHTDSKPKSTTSARSANCQA